MEAWVDRNSGKAVYNPFSQPIDSVPANEYTVDTVVSQG